MDAQKELKELLLEIKGNQDSVKEEMETIKESSAKLFEENKGLKEQVEKLENTPAKKVDLEVPGETKTVKAEMYKGYRLNNQGIELVNRIALPEEKREEMAKQFIDVISKATNVEGNDARGGYLVPDELGSSILAYSRLTSVCLQECTVQPMGSDTLIIPRELSNVTVDWANEESANSETNPTFETIDLVAQRMGAYSHVSNELLADSRFDIVSLLTSQFGEAVGQEIDKQVFGTPTAQKFTDLEGNVDYTVTCGISAGLAAEDFSEAISKLAANKIVGAKFYMNKAFLHKVRSIKDSNNDPIWQMMYAGQPAGIYGYPVVDVEAMRASITLDGQMGILFGNLKNYIIGKRDGNMALMVNPYILMKENMTQYVLSTRWDGEIALKAFVEMVQE